MAAVLALGPGAVLSRRAGAALIGFRPTARAAFEITVPALGRRAATVLRRVLATHIPGTTATRNLFQEAFLALCERHDLPRPEVDHAQGPPS
jgi:hypothetical protein